MDSLESGYRHLRKSRRVSGARTPEAQAAAYVSLRKALGFNAARDERALRQLLGFMRNRGLGSFDEVDRRAAVEWLDWRSRRGIVRDVRLTAPRDLFRYLRSLGVVRGNVWESFSLPKLKRFVPHIFSVAEIRQILDFLRRRMETPPRRTHIHFAYLVMFHTAYACGLRAGEICRLDIGDIDFERALFVVRKTKFGKTRLVPFNARTLELVSRYLRKFRRRDDGMPPGAPLFLNYRRKRFQPGCLSHDFMRMCAAAGVHVRKTVAGNTVRGGTTIHALRHTFAVHRLLKWYEEGASVNAKLPLLATYMGHSEYRHTQRYLTVLSEFTDIAGRLFAREFEAPLKELE